MWCCLCHTMWKGHKDFFKTAGGECKGTKWHYGTLLVSRLIEGAESLEGTPVAEFFEYQKKIKTRTKWVFHIFTIDICYFSCLCCGSIILLISRALFIGSVAYHEHLLESFIRCTCPRWAPPRVLGGTLFQDRVLRLCALPMQPGGTLSSLFLGAPSLCTRMWVSLKILLE